MCKNIICWLIIGSLWLTSSAQLVREPLSFSEVDRFARSVPYRNDYLLLASELTKPYYHDIEKVRAIFVWITHNIAFDYRFINSGKERIEPECDNETDCIHVLRQWEHQQIKRCLQTKKGTAADYCRLFKMMCDQSRIQNEIITGYARTQPYQVGNTMPVNHHWNAVLLDTTWYYLDLTRAAGYCIEDEETGNLLRFVPSFQSYYWINSFTRFSRTHYPKKGKFVEKVSVSKEQFFNKPFYFSALVLENLQEIEPLTGVLKVKKGDTIHFTFHYQKEITWLQINSNIFRNPALWKKEAVGKKKWAWVKDDWAEKKQRYITFNKVGSLYQFYYVVEDNALYYLELAFDFVPAIRYRVRVEN